MEEVKLINKNLTKHYGKSPEGLPCWRLAWTTNQSEKRFGNFKVFYGSIFIREETGVQEVKKYPYKEDQDRWVLERLVPTVGNPELNKITKYSYEPLYIFSDPRTGEYQKPVWKAVNLLVRKALGIIPRNIESPSDLDARDEREFQEEIKRNEEMMDASYIASMIGNKEAIVVPSTFTKE